MTWRIGSATIDRITEVEDWSFAPEDLFPGLVDGDWDAWERDFPESVRAAGPELVLSIHCYLIRLGGRAILVDAGNGNGRHRPILTAHDGFATDFADRLNAVVDPARIDTVISTHLHPDHCGWFTHEVEGTWTPTFGGADYLVDRSDLGDLEALVEADPLTSVEADFARMYDDSVRPVLSRVRTLDGEHVLAEHDDVVVRSVPAPGHTPGHRAVVVEAGGAGAVITGDAIHHPLQLIRDDLRQAGDADPDVAARTRHELLQLVADRGWLLLTAHFPAGSPEHATTIDGRLAWAAPTTAR